MKILVIDGHNQMRRADIRFGSQPDPNEDYTIIYNFFRSFRSLVEQFSPEAIYFVLEGHPKFRYDLLPTYKENRIIKLGNVEAQEKNDRYHKQKRIILDLLKLLPVRQVKAKNYECDDVIAYICRSAPTEDVTVISNDTDFIQLLQEGLSCKIYNPITKKYLEAPEYHYLAYKSLTGDTSDDVPKILTPKKAEKLVSNPKLFEEYLSVPENRERFDLNFNLIKLAEIDSDEIEYVDGHSSFDELKDKFSEMKFDSITNDKSWSRFVDTFKNIS